MGPPRDLRRPPRRDDGKAPHPARGRAELFIDPSAVDPQPAAVTVRVPGNQQVTLSFENTTLSYDSDGVFIGNLQVPVNNAGGSSVTAGGEVVLRSRSMSFDSTAGLTAEIVTAMDPPAGGSVTGTAVVPSGASVTLGFGETPHEIHDGRFSIPYPSD